MMKELQFDLQRFEEVHWDGNALMGTSGDDNLSNDRDGAEIHSGKGYDVISNSGNNVYISAGADQGANIKNSGDNVTAIAGNAPRSFINNSGNNCVLYGGQIINTGKNTKLIGSDQDEKLTNSGDGSTIHSGGGSTDYIGNTGTNVVIHGDSEKNIIENHGGKVTIYGNGGDEVTNYHSEVTIYGGSSNIGNTITNFATDVYINAGTGANKISSSNHKFTIIAGDEDDTVDVTGGDDLKINAGHGKNQITVHAGSRLEITSGDDASTIDVSGYMAKIYSGKEGSDISYNGSAGDIWSGSGKDTIRLKDCDRNTIHSMAEADLILNGDKDNGTKGSDLASIDSGNGDDTIKNYKAVKITVNSGEGKDFFENIDSHNEDGIYSNIYTHTGEDTLINHNSNFVILGAGDDNDYIENDSSNVIILAGEGDDTVYNQYVRLSNGESGQYDIIEGGVGNDSIVNENNDVTISGNEDKDTIENSGVKVSIEGGSGDDSILNDELGIEVTINGSENDDTIENKADVVSINGGSDDDVIKNGYVDGEYKLFVNPYGGYPVVYFSTTEYFKGGDNVTINGGEGNDTIYNVDANNVTINGDKGEDVIKIYEGNNIVVNAGENNDFVFAESKPDSNSKSFNLVINADSGERNYIRVSNSFSNVIINGADVTGQDFITNDSNSALIKGNKGFDQIHNNGINTHIYGGADDDLLSNTADNAVIYGESGKDYIFSADGTDVLIDGGTEDDLIEVYGDIRTNVKGGDGNDKIFLTRVSDNAKQKLLDDCTAGAISAGLSLINSPVTNSKNWSDQIAAAAGAGGTALLDKNKFIISYEFKNTLKISASSWILAVSGILTIIKNLMPNSTLQQLNNEISTVNGGKGDDIIVLDGFAPRIVEYSLGDGNDTIHYFATNMAQDLNDKTVAASHLSTLDIQSGTIEDVSVNGNNVILNISSGSSSGSINLVDAAGFRFKVRENGNVTTRIYGTDSNDNLYMNEENNVIICGNGGNDTILNGYSTSYSFMLGDNTTIDGGTGNDKIYNYGKFVSVSGGFDNDYILCSNKSSNVTINGGDGNDTIDISLVSNVLVEYQDGDCDDIVYGFDSDDTLKISALSYTLERKGFDLIVRVDNGSINLKGCRLLSYLGKINIDGTPENDLVNLEFYDMQLDGDKLSLLKLNSDEILDMNDAPNEIRIIDASKSQTSVKIIGNSSVNEFTGSNKADVYYSEPPSNKNVLKTIRNTASNMLIANADTTESIIMTVRAGGGDDTIYCADRPIFYIYNSGDGNDIIEGFKENDTLKIESGEYTKKVVDKDILITVNENNILLRNATNLSNINIEGLDNSVPMWKLNGTIATYGVLDNTLVTITGLKSNAPVIGISLNGTEITLSNSVLNQGKVTVSDGYTLKLASDVTTPIITNAAWSVSGTTATYKAANTSAGYSLSSDGKTINYTNASGGNTLVTISGLKNGLVATNGIIEGISIENNVVKVSSKITDGEVKITGNGYTLEIVEEVPIPEEFSIKNNRLTVSNKFTGNEINLNEKWASNVTKVNVSALSQDMNITGNDLSNSITGGKGADTINGGDGNDTLVGGKDSDVFIYNSGNDIITDYKPNEDRIQMNPSAITSSTLKGSDVILTTDQGTLTIKGVKDKVVTFVDENGKTSEKIFYADMSYSPLETGLTYDAKRNVLTASSKYTNNEIDLSEHIETIAKVNVSALSQTMNITGNDLANSIKGGKAADTINGGSDKDTISGGNDNDKLYGDNDNDVLKGDAGNDSLYGGSGNDTLTGGAGKDVFVYESGNDVITDYKTGEDKIKISEIVSSSVKGSDVILTTGNGTLTVKGAKDKVVTFVDNNGDTTEKIFYADTSYAPLEIGLTYDAKRTVLTASNKYTGNTIDLGEYLETVAKINASALSQDINITGNDLNNSIKGGKGADTINGGSGKDTIFGGNGDDKLYGGNDNDLLKGDAGNDSLFGSKGNDTLTGGAGSDIFIYESGNDVITDYKTGEDKIQMNPSAITNSTLKGSDVILTTDQGTLTIKGVKDKVVTFVDEGTTTEKIFYADMSYSPLETGLTYDAKKTALTASNKYTDNTIDLGEHLKTIAKVNASALSQDMNITGNNLANSIKSGAGSDIIFGGDLNDTIYGGSGEDKIYGDAGNDKLYGDAGNDTLFGGLGNDTLTGGNGSDVFVYEGGNDVITDYAAGDSIQISSGKISKTSYSGENLVFTIGDSNLTVKNAKGKQISVTDSNGNTTTQIYSGTQTYARTLDLLYDCNFMTDELQINDVSEVTANNYSIGQIQTVSNGDIFDKVTLVSDSSSDKK